MEPFATAAAAAAAAPAAAAVVVAAAGAAAAAAAAAADAVAAAVLIWFLEDWIVVGSKLEMCEAVEDGCGEEFLPLQGTTCAGIQVG